MPTILITGATGNVGMEVLNHLKKASLPVNIIATVRDTTVDRNKLKCYDIKVVEFDVTNASTFTTFFKNIDVLFLLRPPQISMQKNILNHS